MMIEMSENAAVSLEVALLERYHARRDKFLKGLSADITTSNQSGYPIAMDCYECAEQNDKLKSEALALLGEVLALREALLAVRHRWEPTNKDRGIKP